MRTLSSIRNFLRGNGGAYVFLAPWLIGFFVLTVYPMIYSLGLSFTDYDFTQPNATQWIGLSNYLKMFGSVFGLEEFTAPTGEVMLKKRPSFRGEVRRCVWSLLSGSYVSRGRRNTVL